ncbi:protein DpdJ [Bacillus sp. X1(2014)]|uniref:protein DpdJ n=1 Tax=Bacillus sp. X1(2014) TaxID=1565991 RepID=UPI0011A6AF15|nr:protein DpdJ [Bacillus sp. X1(2014)]
MNLEEAVREFLSFIEDREAKLLSWGYVDGGFSEEEIFEMAEEWLEKHDQYFSPNELVDDLWEKRMILDIQANNRVLIRTRMAETVRLLARLKQIFSAEKWKESPTLVSDYRFQTRPRKYPRRDISVDTAKDELSPLLNEYGMDAVHHLLNRERFLLSEFQIRAVKTMLKDLESNSNRGMIVCSGTGTGKTLSFYLPALTHIAGQIEKNDHWTKALALYPRNELLKDQFMETYKEARRLDTYLLKRGARKLQIGAFFGPTPKSINLQDIDNKWSLSSDKQGYVCPYITCPNCDRPMVWKKKDITKKIERLTCSLPLCHSVIGNDEVLLTRDSMRKELPDVVFTTTEMLNRTMSDSWYGKLIGLFTNRPPLMMLLDEVHTYEGAHGAQVALLIRRWRRAVNSPIHFTGLSATLEEAASFFSQLTGLEVPQIEEIVPLEDDMIPEGKEYQLILRGDPVSGTSLLSTTIQTSMLLRRMLDRNGEPSEGMAGQKIFVFTDDLDVTNRLYHNILDAEGLNSWGRPVRNKKPLAIHRKHNAPEAKERLRLGQSWFYAEQIGHDLSQSIPIGRTSSQDAGVAANAEIVVSTASLEVGYNDPDVGGVVQHKAPMDLASFLQRKGRAGRNRVMRPWMVTVLSDYGRDRLVYQSYETLFDPVLEKRNLPINNRYVLRMQAVYCLMEWLSEEIHGPVNVWNDFCSPYGDNAPKKKQRQEKESELLLRLMKDERYRNKFAAYLEDALNITREDVHSILWEPPRAIMYSVIPTILRRLKMNWSVFNKPGKQESYKTTSPLPEFIPSNLFSDLNLPEVMIDLPETKFNQNDNEEMMPILQALNTFSPGKVTRRFGIHTSNESHWIAPPVLEAGKQELPLSTFCPELEPLGEFEVVEDGRVMRISAFRPWVIHPVRVDDKIAPTSNSQLIWKSQLFPTFEFSGNQDQKNGLTLSIPRGAAWNKTLKEIVVHSHNLRSTVTVRRFALGSAANIRVNENGQTNELETEISFTDEVKNPTALGYTLQVDGIVFRYVIPKGDIISPSFTDPVTLRSFRTAYFRHLMMTDKRLDGIVNIFQRERLGEVYLSAISSKAMKNNQSLEQAHREWKNANFLEVINEVLDVIFQGLSENDEVPDENGEKNRQKVHQSLLSLCEQDIVVNTMHDLAAVLWGEMDDNWQQWALERWKTTLGGALLLACKQMTGQFNSGDLIVDVDGGPRPPEMNPIPEGVGEIWITETTSGGSGIIEEIVKKYHDDPKRFFRLVESALDPSDAELIDSELTRCLKLMDTQLDLQVLFQNVRTADNYKVINQLLEELNQKLSESGILLTHSVRNAIYNRILKPGSTKETDDLLRSIMELWKQEEERLGIETDGRVFAYMFSSNPSIVNQFKHSLQHIDPQALQDENWRYQVIYGLLWPKGNIIGAKALDYYNPFSKNVPMERELLSQSINHERKVWITDESWYEKTVEILKESSHVQLYAHVENKDDLRNALLRLASEPIDVGYLHIYPRVEGMKRDSDHYIVTVDIREEI